VTGIAYASKSLFENCASKHVPYCCTRAPGYFCHCQDSRLFRSSLDLGPHSLLPWRLARSLLPSGSPRLKTSIKNPKKSERVRPRRCLAQIYLSFRGIGSFELIASLDLVMGSPCLSYIMPRLNDGSSFSRLSRDDVRLTHGYCTCVLIQRS